MGESQDMTIPLWKLDAGALDVEDTPTASSVDAKEAPTDEAIEVRKVHADGDVRGAADPIRGQRLAGSSPVVRSGTVLAVHSPAGSCSASLGGYPSSAATASKWCRQVTHPSRTRQDRVRRRAALRRFVPPAGQARVPPLDLTSTNVPATSRSSRSFGWCSEQFERPGPGHSSQLKGTRRWTHLPMTVLQPDLVGVLFYRAAD